MAYSSDHIPDRSNAMSRDSEWFRINQSQSRTPVSQERAVSRIPDYPNNPHRQPVVLTPMQQMVEDLAQSTRERLLAAYTPPLTPPHLLPRPNAPVTRLAMHGGAGPGERYQPRSPRVSGIKTNPVPATPGVRFQVERRGVAKAFVPSQISAVADQRVARGVSEAAFLASEREKARLRDLNRS